MTTPTPTGAAELPEALKPVPRSLLEIVFHHEALTTRDEVRRMAAELLALRAQPAGAATLAKPSPHADADEIALFDEYMRGCREYNIEPDLGTAFHAGRKSARGAATPAAQAPGVPSDLEDIITAAQIGINSVVFRITAGNTEGALEVARAIKESLARADQYLLAAAPQPPAAAQEPEGWITMWPSGYQQYMPIYSHGPTKPGHGPQLDAWLRKYPVYTHPSPQPAATAGAVDALDADTLARVKSALATTIEPTTVTKVIAALAAQRGGA